MDNDRSAVITIAGREYRLVLTTRATKTIAARYGGLEHLGDKLMRGEHFEDALGEVVWLVTLLANQSIMIRNLSNAGAPEPLLTEDEVELLTSPLDLASYRSAITEALVRGAKRNIESEDTGKNAQSG